MPTILGWRRPGKIGHGGHRVGTDSANPKVRFTSVQEPPVPIPNTEVKLQSAEDTRLATARENRPKRTFLLSSVGRAHDC